VALNIKNAETEKLVRELARRRGQGITEVLTDVLRREVEHERRKRRRSETNDLLSRIQVVVDDVKKLKILDERTPDEILGYNEHGHFD
jgi:antitoxin VapB